jgi:outer membrane murein-binding lipoprotein Lpp
MNIKSVALTAVTAVVLLSGCATPARVDQMTATTTRTVAATIPEALRQNIAIKDVTGGQETNPLWTSQVSSAEFERALEASLRVADLGQINRQAGRFTLTAQLGKLDQPFVGISMTVTASVLYILVERSTGKTVWQNTITTPYTASFGDAVIGVERLKLANEGAVRTNITELINQLLQLRL